MISYKEACGIISKEIEQIILLSEEVEILSSVGRVLAEDIIADVDLPPFNNSAVDGYAVRFGQSREWNIVGEVSAGNYKQYSITDKDAVLITTGSKMPDGTDTSIPIEIVDVMDDTLYLKEGTILKQGMNVREKGNDLVKDKVALLKYEKISSKNIGALATCGKSKVKVFRKLKIAVLATGDELIAVDEVPVDDKIRISNIYSICAAIVELGHEPVVLGFVKDIKELIREEVVKAIALDIDILITTGGVSVGKYDFLKEIFNEIGIQEKFWKVNIKPGKPIFFGTFNKSCKEILVFGLPGNPVSSSVNFSVFIRPALDKLYKQNVTRVVNAVLQEDIQKKDDKRHFFNGVLYEENSIWKVNSRFSNSSGNLIEMSRANCFIVFKEELKNLFKGDEVTCIRM
ncbi:MAG: molybdopterin molybdotransferase MoeA [Ignavibacteriales bacterium]|nr:molybdopterin molybdotransferase MoeA [Ignavibacteriales bacterium]